MKCMKSIMVSFSVRSQTITIRITRLENSTVGNRNGFVVDPSTKHWILQYNYEWFGSSRQSTRNVQRFRNKEF